MKQNKEDNRLHAKKVLEAANIKWESFNNDLHWKIGEMDFFPTTGKWRHIKPNAEIQGEGVMQLVEHLRNKHPMYKLQGIEITKQLSVDQMFNIAAHSREKTLIGICRAIHKEIYG